MVNREKVEGLAGASMVRLFAAGRTRLHAGQRRQQGRAQVEEEIRTHVQVRVGNRLIQFKHILSQV